jgi:hypothetical protein
MLLKDITKFHADTKGFFKYKDPMGFEVELKPVMLETDEISLQLLVAADRGATIVQAIDKVVTLPSLSLYPPHRPN